MIRHEQFIDGAEMEQQAVSEHRGDAGKPPATRVAIFPADPFPSIDRVTDFTKNT